MNTEYWLNQFKGATLLTIWYGGGILLGAILMDNLPLGWASDPIGLGITLILMLASMQPVAEKSHEYMIENNRDDSK